ncbi:hypothetical protein BJ912DRAFT_1046581 [Pholiota molesta]|nr:hypothetical protein BJ912DRAFT_1046581 [Pholiota molesta]
MADPDQVNPAGVHAYTLVKALENVILPIVNAILPGIAVSKGAIGAGQGPGITVHSVDGKGTGLQAEAQHLVSALEKFITALVRPQIVQKDTTESEEAIVTPALDDNLSIAQVSRDQIPSEQPPLLKLALEELRYRVFNTMPIRVLAFNSDGSGMELIERGTVLARVSIAMESDFYESNVQSEIRHFEDNPTFVNYVIEKFISQHTKYAILSHTWLHDAPGEVTYAAWKSGNFDKDSAGYEKLANFCRVAATEYGATFGWMDTICINKDSSAELDESIRSMYSWYSGASVCITYLAQTTTLQRMRHDPWFTRGWTLQELLASQLVEFYGANWEKLAPNLNTDERKRLIEVEIETATSISPEDYKSFKSNRHSLPISRRMKWAADRQVTRQEDVAYSLMGMFGVSLSIAYGEGSQQAFVRLVKEILNLPGSSCLDILNWGCGPDANMPYQLSSSAISSLIPPSPKQYLWHANTDIDWPAPRIPITLTHLRLHISVLLMPAVSTDTTSADTSFTPIGNIYANAEVELVGVLNRGNPSLEMPKNYNLLDAAASRGSSGWNRTNDRLHIIFGILNFQENDRWVHLPHSSSCFAICLHRMESEGLGKLPTSRAVSVDLKLLSSREAVTAVPKGDLAQHGMQLVTMYL